MPRRTSRHVSRSEWQTKGMTERSERAAARFGLTVKQLEEAKIECQWRSYFGNSYAVVKISDVAALSRKLKAEEAQKEEKRLIEKHGEEGLKKIRDAEKKAAEQKQLIQRYKGQLTFLQEVEMKLNSTGGHILTYDNEEPRMGKTATKSSFKLKQSHMYELSGKEIAVGRRKFYKASDIIKVARPYRTSQLDLSQIYGSDALQAYAYVLSNEMKETIEKMEPESIEEAQKQAKAEVSGNIKKAEVVYEQAKSALANAEKALEQAKDGIDNFEEFLDRLPGAKKKGKKRAASGKGKKKKKAKNGKK